jgi:hypothetical protein
VPELKVIESTGNDLFPIWAWYLILSFPLTGVVLVLYWLWIKYYKPKGLKDQAFMV